jgi:hypothetical protein
MCFPSCMKRSLSSRDSDALILLASKPVVSVDPHTVVFDAIWPEWNGGGGSGAIGSSTSSFTYLASGSGGNANGTIKAAVRAPVNKRRKAGAASSNMTDADVLVAAVMAAAGGSSAPSCESVSVSSVRPSVPVTVSIAPTLTDPAPIAGAGHSTGSLSAPLSFPCPECGQTFAKRPYLQAHLVVHAGVRPYRCIECDVSFTHRSTWASHNRVLVSKYTHTHTHTQSGCCRLVSDSVFIGRPA